MKSQAIIDAAGIPAMIGAPQLVPGTSLRPGVWKLEQLDLDSFTDNLDAWRIPGHVREVNQLLEP